MGHALGRGSLDFSLLPGMEEERLRRKKDWSFPSAPAPASLLCNLPSLMASEPLGMPSRPPYDPLKGQAPASTLGWPSVPASITNPALWTGSDPPHRATPSRPSFSSLRYKPVSYFSSSSNYMPSVVNAFSLQLQFCVSCIFQ